MNGSDRPAPHGEAPGAPGIGPTWCSSAKEMVGTALGPSRVWFTIGGGIVNEVYYPRVDIPQIRDLGFVVADGQGFWVEVKRLEQHTIETPRPGVPALRIEHRHGRFRLALRIVPSATRDVLLVEVVLEGDADLRPYVLLAPHLGGTGHDNEAEVAEHRGRRVLWAEQGPFGLALVGADAADGDAIGAASAGYVGASDGWQDFDRNGALTWGYERAGPGNVALVAELPCRSVLALGLGSSRESAATLAASALLEPFETSWRDQCDEWDAWHGACAAQGAVDADLPAPIGEALQTSAMVLRAHQDKTYPGTMVASLSVPWGNTRDERGGYHLVWPRDLVECAGALLALGAEDEARDTLRYLVATQHPDGHWFQNQWLGGKFYWQGIQLDEAAFPVLLAAALAERDALAGIPVAAMVHRALGFVMRNGPASDQDRWEEDAGVNTFTLAICIAALVAGAPFLEPGPHELALDFADWWNASLEDWTVARDTVIGRACDVSAHYVRVAPAPVVADREALLRALEIKNKRHDPNLPAAEQIGVDFLQLVRFGLRAADDPVILDTVHVVDQLLRVETPSGPSWYRYNDDGYGEHRDGRPFDGTGHGRAWPLLTGERGHYELCAGHDPLPYMEAMCAMAGDGGMIPEQVWDAAPIPERFLAPGRPTGSAMPLAWAHAELVKLARSRRAGAPVDRPRAVWERYRGRRPEARRAFWCAHAPITRIAPGTRLTVCLPNAGVVHHGLDGWKGVADAPTRDTGLGLHAADLDTQALAAGEHVDFTYRGLEAGSWVGRDFRVEVVSR